MRPQYESEKDLIAERAVIKTAFPNDSIQKIPKSYGADFVVDRNGKLLCWVEVKCRNAFYAQPFISLQKMLKSVELSERTLRPFYLIFSFPNDQMFAKQVTRADLVNLQMGGRKDRGDWQDVEPMVMFKIKDFKPLKDWRIQ